jgi:hypothetical protein
MGELAPPDAVLITHQDADHFDLGVLMSTPETTTIVVPAPSPDMPWDVDLGSAIARVLGDRRRIVRLAHGETFPVGDLEVQAFPFLGEMPPSLPHRWNAYLVKTRRSAAAFTADARLDESTVDFLARNVGRERSLRLFAGPPRERALMPGWREGLFTTQLWTAHRLWGFYVPPWSLFQPTPCANVTFDLLRRLASAANLVGYFPYAVGSTPWHRIDQPTDPLHLPVSSLGAADLDAIRAGVETTPVDFLPLRYGVPYELE